MAKNSAPSINLAKNRGEHLTDKILRFALTIGRVMIIFTEAIALSAFLFRFGLDRQLIDLHDKIKQEEAIVALLKRNESTYRNLQDRLTLEKNVSNATADTMKLYSGIMAIIPSDITISNLSFSSTNIHIEGSVGSLISLSSLVKKIKASSSIAGVSLDKLENKTSEGSITFSLTAHVKQVKVRTLL